MSDTSKPRLGLVPMRGLRRVARVFEAGLKEGRDPNDWQHRLPKDFVDALLRHASDFQDNDPEDEEDHLAAIVANALILMWHEGFKLTPEEGEVLDAIASGPSFSANGLTEKQQELIKKGEELGLQSGSHWRCGDCGEVNNLGSRCCRNCGSPLTRASLNQEVMHWRCGRCKTINTEYQDRCRNCGAVR